MAADDFLAGLWRSDPAPKQGGLDFPARLREDLARTGAFAAESAKFFRHVVVLGVGGNALVPAALRETFGTVAGYPELHVLDSTDPGQIAALEAQLDLETTLFVLASKSGTTTEPEVFFRYFFDRLRRIVGADAASKQFVAITDPDSRCTATPSLLDSVASSKTTRTVAGRYSALSYFGIVPAALAGYDVATLLDRGLTNSPRMRARRRSPAEALALGATIALLAKAGRDKLTLVTHPRSPGSARGSNNCSPRAPGSTAGHRPGRG